LRSSIPEHSTSSARGRVGSSAGSWMSPRPSPAANGTKWCSCSAKPTVSRRSSTASTTSPVPVTVPDTSGSPALTRSRASSTGTPSFARPTGDGIKPQAGGTRSWPTSSAWRRNPGAQEERPVSLATRRTRPCGAQPPAGHAHAGSHYQHEQMPFRARVGDVHDDVRARCSGAPSPALSGQTGVRVRTASAARGVAASVGDAPA
jgi:hypothetical protein